MKLRRLFGKRKIRKEPMVEPEEMTFTEIMHLITKRPVIDHRTREARHDTVVEINPS